MKNIHQSVSKYVKNIHQSISKYTKKRDKTKDYPTFESTFHNIFHAKRPYNLTIRSLDINKMKPGKIVVIDDKNWKDAVHMRPRDRMKVTYVFININNYSHCGRKMKEIYMAYGRVFTFDEFYAIYSAVKCTNNCMIIDYADEMIWQYRLKSETSHDSKRSNFDIFDAVNLPQLALLLAN